MADSRPALSHGHGTSATVPRRIFCLWVGDQPMSRNRENALYTIQTNTGVSVELITNKTLEEFILPDHPLHKAYEHLSGTHKADYLRAYLMHYHGGGYSDLKYTFKSWVPTFDAIDKKGTGMQKWVAGYHEVGPDGVAWVEDEELQESLNSNWTRLLGNGAYICRPQTPFTATWLKGVEAALDRFYPSLVKNPAQHPRDAKGKPLPDGRITNYPVPWSYLHGSMFHPACLKYADHLVYGLPEPVFVGYQ